jgi:hypothetical protein
LLPFFTCFHPILRCDGVAHKINKLARRRRPCEENLPICSPGSQQRESAVTGQPGIVQRMRKRLKGMLLGKPRSKSLEWQIIQSYVWVLRAPQDTDGYKTCALARHGAYEVRLIEPSQLPDGVRKPFWIELFDHDQKMILDSFSSDDLEEAATIAGALIAEAKYLQQHSIRRPFQRTG